MSYFIHNGDTASSYVRHFTHYCTPVVLNHSSEGRMQLPSTFVRPSASFNKPIILCNKLPSAIKQNMSFDFLLNFFGAAL